jgi:hypothetical protein
MTQDAISLSSTSEQTVSPDAARAKAFYAYLTRSLGRPQNEAEVKAWIWKTIKDGYRPALLPDDYIYRPSTEDIDAE